MPKKKCCISKPKCKRCPLRMLAEGNLPQGYTVRKRKLVKAEPGDVLLSAGTKATKKSGKKKSKSGKKRRLLEAA
jgi:hypothetical protein